jgi:hypothetical protein
MTMKKGKCNATLHNMRRAPIGVFAYCRECGNRASANPDDYFTMPSDEHLLSCCEKPMVLCREIRKVVLLDPLELSE